MEETLKTVLQQAAAKVAGRDVEIVLEHPAELAHGDLACTVALALAKEVGEAPRVVAERIVAELGAIDGVEKIEIAGPGFINVTLSRDARVASVEDVLKADASWGANSTHAGEKIICEYTDPNPFKAFHIGHLMSNAIGESIARLMEYTGAQVKRANYQGDVGRHVACAIWALRQAGEEPMDAEQLGRAYTRGAIAFKEDEEAKREIVAINKALYVGEDAELMALYEKGRQTSLDSFEKVYALLGTKFDHYFFESTTGPFGKELVEANTDNGVFEKSEGAVVYPGERDGLHTRVFLNAEGLPTYEAKELGLAKMKYDTYPYDRSFIITANEINEYFKVLLAAMRHIWPELSQRTEHLGHGMLQLSSGKMSSSKGNVITGEALINDMRGKALQKLEGRNIPESEKHAVANAVAVAGIKYTILRQGMGKNITFDPERSLSLEGDSGPYLQYAHTRARSILKKAEAEGVALSTEQASAGVVNLERLLYRFPEVVRRAQEEYEPHHVAGFLLLIAGEFNSWYAREQIVDKGDPLSPYKVALTQAFATTMKRGLWLLGIEAPERM